MTPNDKKHIRIWYWSGALLVFLMVVIGGITRLTGSGLSMTDWKPIMGAIPPLSEMEWMQAFDQYKQFPEYREVNYNMDLTGFKWIFFWEYIHRLMGRLLGLVFIIPFAWFLIRKNFSPRQLRRSLFLLGLGIAQGLIGWYMVKSGLVDLPSVSHYRLAAHLLLAVIIFGSCIWFAMDLHPRKRISNIKGKDLKLWLSVFLGILVLQIIWGAFVAGLNAGHIYNTFPKMYQHWMPPELWVIEPLMLNFTENLVTVQWLHRALGTLLGVLVFVIWIKTCRINIPFSIKKWSLALFSVVLFQYAVGIFTLMFHVPVWLGVFHQAIALVVFGIALIFFNRLKTSGSYAARV